MRPFMGMCLGVLALLYVILVVWALRAIRMYHLIRKRFLTLPAQTRRKYQAFDRIDFDNVRRVPIGADGDERSFGRPLRWNWDLAVLCVGAIFVFPIRLVCAFSLAASNLVWLHLLSTSCTLDVTLANVEALGSGFRSPGSTVNRRAERDADRAGRNRRLLKVVMGLHCRFEMFLMGVTRIREYHVVDRLDSAEGSGTASSEGHDSQRPSVSCQPGFPPGFHPDAPRCIVANHVSCLDILYFIWRSYPSFIAKAAALRDPIVGPCAKALNCVFIDRKSTEDREKAKKLIDERQTELWKLSVREYLNEPCSPQSFLHDGSSECTVPSSAGSCKNEESSPITPRISFKLKSLIEVSEQDQNMLKPNKIYVHDVPPLLIFPEGTTSAQRSVMPFKKGAFLGMKPVTPVVLIYRTLGFHLAFDIIPTIWWLPLCLSSPFPTTLDVYWLPQVMPPPPYDIGEESKRAELVSEGVDDVDLAATMTSLSDREPSRIVLFAENVRRSMSSVLQAFGDWPMPKNVAIPEEWGGSLRLKFESINEIFTGSPSERPVGQSPQRRRKLGTTSGVKDSGQIEPNSFLSIFMLFC